MLNGEYRVRKLRWKSRRGMKELDVLFEAFFAQQTNLLLTGGWPRLEEVLEQEDTLLLEWVSGRNLPADPDLLVLIEAISHAA